MVTLPGDFFASRMSASILKSVGLSDWIAGDTDEYIRIATSWARDVERLASLRTDLRERMRVSPLCDAPSFTRNLEAAFRQVWREWRRRSTSEPNEYEVTTHQILQDRDTAPSYPMKEAPSNLSIAQEEKQLDTPEIKAGNQRSVLNVGSGSANIPIPGHYENWKHDLLDIDPKANPDVLLDARELLSMPPNLYDAVYCSHNLEHFYPYEVSKVLTGMRHVLKPDGFAEIRVPDIQAVAEHWIKNGMDIEDILYQSSAGPISIRDVFYGFGKEIEPSGQDSYLHKTGFTAKSLANILIKSGFYEVKVQRDRFEVRAVAFKQNPETDQVALLGIT